MKLTFIGAAQTVTGSMHLLEVNGTKILLDCGLYQGKRKEAFEINRTFDQFDPKKIDVVILSHAHIDHSGNLPNLVKQGFSGPIYSTFASRDLAGIMLRDSAHIQEKDVEFVNKKRVKAGKNPFEPLYTDQDVLTTTEQFIGINYKKSIPVAPGVKLTFYDAGHILGSAVVHLEITEKDRMTSFGFSGDLGRPNLPILRDPEMIPQVDHFICESTYGGRLHDDYDTTEGKMAEIIKNAAAKKLKLIVPAFSVGRTQELLYLLNELFDGGKAPRIPIFVDSPLSTNATDVFRLHPECFDAETLQVLHERKDPWGFNQLNYIRAAEESKKLNSAKGPMMIISSSGMAEAGRILHHLANNVENPNAVILMTGFCAEHTLGRRIIERQPELNILGDVYKLKADVITFNSLSAHADADELKAYVNGFERERLKNIFLVHGEKEQQDIFKGTLQQMGFGNVSVPAKGDTFEL